MNYFKANEAIKNIPSQLEHYLAEISPKDKLNMTYQSHHEKMTFTIYNQDNVLEDTKNNVLETNYITIENEELKLMYYSRDNLDSEKVKIFFDKLMIHLSSEIN